MTGHLEIDHERGVIYFHSDLQAYKAGYCPTPLRICGIGKIDHPLRDRQIDVTVRHKGGLDGEKTEHEVFIIK